MTTEDRDAMIEKIRKLLDLSKDKGASEAEAALAAAKASELLARFALSEADVMKKTENRAVVMTTFPCKRGYFEITLCNMVARLNFCKYVVFGNKTHMLIGDPVDAKVAQMLFEYLRDTINRLSNKTWLEQNGGQYGDRAQRGVFVRSFRVACTNRLCWRMHDLLEERIKGEAPKSDGTNLPALANMYQLKLGAADEKFKEQYGDTTKKKKAYNPKSSSAMGQLLGDMAGQEISLDQQIAGNGETKRLTSN